MIGTGFKNLDGVLTGLRIGDNVVWQVDDIKEYIEYADSFAAESLRSGKKVIYMRFASHKKILEPAEGVTVYELDSHDGFEAFSTEVNSIITREGVGVHYVFDSLSDLLPAWATDLMVGNFFMVTCPYLYELDTVAYFALIRNYHSYKTIARIRETTQLLIDIYDCNGEFYVHPLKVWNRYSPTMFLPHLKQGDKFTPITDSVEATKALCYMKNPVAEGGKRNLDYWDRMFMKGEDLLADNASREEKKNMVSLFSNVMISKDPKILSLVENTFSLEDLLEIKSRMIGTGIIGGKAVGMLLARKLLSEDADLNWEQWSEPHDSFYIGSDVFYSYIVQNGWWKLRLEQKTEEGYFDAARVMGEKILHGKFPEETREQFQRIMEYFGQSPIIVRSSSLLEDGFGNAFAGKYDSFFLSNQGSPEERFVKFVEAVRKIYASTMSEDALVYRKQRGLDKLDEQMALLVQRVSGAYHGKYFFPDMAGVGISYNTYVWSKDMSPEAGMMRIVMGLGTRAVNRVEGDYPRIAALDRPLLRPHAGRDELVKYSQREVDVINVGINEFDTISLEEASAEDVDYLLDSIGKRDHEGMRILADRGIEREAPWVITFDDFFSSTDFVGNMNRLMKSLEKGYNYPVDVEFTVNLTPEGAYRVNLLQCRPLQTRGLGKKVEIPEGIKKEDTMFSSGGYFFGGNISQDIHRIIYVDPGMYTALPETGKYDIARAVGKLNRKIPDSSTSPTLLLGPGRWGTSTPSLGVPVNFSEINNIAVLGEISFSGGNLMPELSFGTHFFQDLVETEIFYVAIFPEKPGTYYDAAWTAPLKDIFTMELPEYAKYKGVIGVYEVRERGLRMVSDVMAQKMICYYVMRDSA
jgi:hypothetical protein